MQILMQNRTTHNYNGANTMPTHTRRENTLVFNFLIFLSNKLHTKHSTIKT